jgi:RNA polymerase sigma-70 factor (ECF subfamily)
VTAAQVRSRPDNSDAVLAAQGDAEAFERLYRSQVARIHSLARRMAGEEVADDLTQEVFIRAWQKLGTFKGTSSFGTWLHRLAVNLILSKRTVLARRRDRHVAGDGVLERMSGRTVPAGLAMDIENAMGHLPDGARQVFVLYDVEGYTHQEIAEAMEISVGTSKSQLHRARMLLRGHLN